MQHDITIVLLAGGRATRLPGKLSLRIGGEPMLRRVFRALTSSGLPCIISARAPLPADLFGGLDVPTVLDEYADAGPLGGLASAAARIETPLLFAAAADLPNLDDRAIDVLRRRYERESPDGRTVPEAIVPRHKGGDVEPLAALYETKPFLASAVAAVRSGRYRVSEALAGLRISYYDIPALEESRYLNVNTAQDFQSISIL